MLPKVSIITITYNHEKFILEAIKSFLDQDYNGPIEVIIANDNSPDNTHKVVTTFLESANVPDNFEIKYTKHEVNKGMMPNFSWALQQATGKYIALCDGDDYWIDPLKLQKQVDFLEKNYLYGLVFSNCEQYFWEKEEFVKTKFGIKEVILDREYSRVEIFEKWLIPTASVVFRKENFCFEKFNKIIANNNLINGDIVLFLFITKKIKIYGMSDVMTVYNRHSGGATLNNSISHIKFINHLNEVIRIFGPEFKTPLIKEIIAKYYFNIAKNEFNKSKINVIKNVIYSFINDPKIILYRIKLKLKDLYK